MIVEEGSSRARLGRWLAPRPIPAWLPALPPAPRCWAGAEFGFNLTGDAGDLLIGKQRPVTVAKLLGFGHGLDLSELSFPGRDLGIGEGGRHRNRPGPALRSLLATGLGGTLL